MFGVKANIGLDIGSQSIKLVELTPSKKAGKTIGLLNLFHQPIAGNFEESLQKVINVSGIKNKPVNTALGGEAVIVRLINVPEMSDKELNESLKFEAEKYIPFNLAETVLQGQVLRRNLPDNKMQILLTAVKNKSIEDLISLLNRLSLKLNIIDVESFALYNAFEFNHPLHKETALLLNIGARILNINILRGGKLSFCRDVFLGGEIFTKQIMKNLVISENEAEKLKREPSGKKEEILESLKHLFSNLKNEISFSIDYFESQNEEKVRKIYVSGGSAGFFALKDFFDKDIELEMEEWDPLSVFERGPAINSKIIEADKAMFAIAVGLALRS